LLCDPTNSRQGRVLTRVRVGRPQGGVAQCAGAPDYRKHRRPMRFPAQSRDEETPWLWMDRRRGDPAAEEVRLGWDATRGVRTLTTYGNR
jgi:hypothetical protein